MKLAGTLMIIGAIILIIVVIYVLRTIRFRTERDVYLCHTFWMMGKHGFTRKIVIDQKQETGIVPIPFSEALASVYTTIDNAVLIKYKRSYYTKRRLIERSI
jgi:hypothetical protein